MGENVACDDFMAMLKQGHDVGIENMDHGTSTSLSIFLRFSAMILSTSSKSGSSLYIPANSASG